ncbi:MAG: PfkB family carbohydrate kinase [Candidatus Poseidoniaceae archaeon]|nr:PfkB family carbohydrate kinase [Candidatus Poseidoniaceae archaeon]
MGMNEIENEIHDRLLNLQTMIKEVSGDIVLVGDIMLDRYIHGYANNLNSRAPVPVLKETKRDDDVGAAAHVARGLENIGLDASLFGVVGDDEAGVSIIEALEKEGVECDGIAVIDGRTTTVKTRLIAGREYLITNQQLLLRWDIEDDRAIDEEALDEIMDQAVKRITNSDVLVISDYGQGVVTDESAARLVNAAKSAKVPVVCDPKLTGLHRTKGADWVIFQTRGLDLMAKRMACNTASEAAAILVKENQWGNLMVLQGENGVIVYTTDGEIIHATCTVEQARGVIGIIDAAGVAVCAGVKLGLSPLDIAHLANAACECIMSKDNNFTLTREDLADRLGEVAWSLQISQR